MELAKFDAAKRAIAEAASVDEVKDIRDKAEAVRAYLKQSGEGLEMQNRAAEIKLRAERKGGDLLANNPDFGRGKKSVTMTDLGIDENQSKRWQRIACINDDDFEAFVSDTLSANRELTTAATLRLAKKQSQSDRDDTLELSTDSFDELPDATFQTIYADPPWKYGNQGTRASTDNHYPTMSVEDICDLDVSRVATADSALFLWTTNGFLIPALTEVIPAWGFTYKSVIVWVKPQMGMGNYVRVSHEFLLIATRGKKLVDGKRQMSWVSADRTGKHSEKPAAFRSIVEDISPGPRLEMFARSAFDGWAVWGNECP